MNLIHDARAALVAASIAGRSGRSGPAPAQQAVRRRRQAAADHDPGRVDAVVSGVREGRRPLRAADRQQDQARHDAVRRHARKGAQRGALGQEPVRPHVPRHAMDHRVLRGRLPRAAQGDRCRRSTCPKEVLSYGDSGYWNAQKRWRTADGGKLMAYTVLGNVQLLYYRADLFKAAGHRAAEDLGRRPRRVHQAQRPAEDVRLRRARREGQRHPLRLAERDAGRGRFGREGSRGRRLHRDDQQPAGEGGARPVHRSARSVAARPTTGRSVRAT